MKHKHYLVMTKRQAAAALEEHLAERPAALERLRAELVAHGVRPEELLDGTPESLTPLWRWIVARIAAVSDQYAPVDLEAEPPSSWPCWARCATQRRARARRTAS